MDSPLFITNGTEFVSSRVCSVDRPAPVATDGPFGSIIMTSVSTSVTQAGSMEMYHEAEYYPLGRGVSCMNREGRKQGDLLRL
jgi:hypothetical protein